MHAGVDRTWAALLRPADWWHPPAGERLVFEPRLAGRLGTTEGEHLDTGTLWGHVAVLDPGRELALAGSMGLPGPVAGHWSMVLDAVDDRTTVTVEHRVLGPVSAADRHGFATGWPRALALLAEDTAHSRRERTVITTIIGCADRRRFS